MSDTAKGPLAGYLFQLEKALFLLSDLDNQEDYISIEDVDDIAVHDGNNETILLTVQAKHSISSNGTTFEDTSYALWRTLEIWITKTKEGVFDEHTEFICSTNKEILKDSLIYHITEKPFEEVLKIVNELYESQQEKLKKRIEQNRQSGNHIKKINNIIKYVLKNEISFKIIKDGLKIHDNEEVKKKVINKIGFGATKYTQTQRDRVYDEFYGWIIGRSKAKWCNNRKALFTKKEFDDKLYEINSNSAIINAIFRTKKELETLDLVSTEIVDKMKTELYVKQIECINRKLDVKEQMIRDAIIEFIYYDNELKHVILDGNYTEPDFDEFIDHCYNIWLEKFNSIVIYDSSEYDENQKNDLAVKVFDKIMSSSEVKFKEVFAFTSSNKYFKNGCFLKLSNTPKIGWHPDWKQKFN